VHGGHSGGFSPPRTQIAWGKRAHQRLAPIATSRGLKPAPIEPAQITRRIDYRTAGSGRPGLMMGGALTERHTKNKAVMQKAPKTASAPIMLSMSSSQLDIGTSRGPAAQSGTIGPFRDKTVGNKGVVLSRPFKGDRLFCAQPVSSQIEVGFVDPNPAIELRA
jgi:hypothetical protein